MDLILICFLLLPLLVPHAHSQTCSLITPSPSSACNVCPTSSVLSIGATSSPTPQPIAIGTTSTGTITVGGGPGSTLSLGATASPSVSTVTIGGTGSTINIGPIPSAAPSPYPTVTVMGVSPNDWSSFTTPTPTPTAIQVLMPTPNVHYSMPWVSNGYDSTPTTPVPTRTAITNTNPRATPTRNAYLTPCPVPSPTPTPTNLIGFVAVGAYDCIVLPMSGYWRLSANVGIYYSAGISNWVGFYYTPMIAGLDATTGSKLVGWDSVGSNQDQLSFVSAIITVPSSAPVVNTYAVTVRSGLASATLSFGSRGSFQNKNVELRAEYIGPL